MKGYKATNNMKCLDLTYVVGKTYSIDKLEISQFDKFFDIIFTKFLGLNPESTIFLILFVFILLASFWRWYGKKCLSVLFPLPFPT